MAELALPHEQYLRLRAQAHRLGPLVRLGAAGLSEAVLREIDRALRSHGLIKVRAAGPGRVDRDALFRTMAERLGAARVQLIGNTFVLFRPKPEVDPQPAPVKAARKRPAPVRGETLAARGAPSARPGTAPRRARGRRTPQR